MTVAPTPTTTEAPAQGCIYVLSNAAMPGIYKIGMSTAQDAETRAAQLSRGSGVPKNFIIELVLPCYYPRQAERHIFHTLRRYRYSPKEFFNLALPVLLRIVTRIISDHYSHPDPASSYLAPPSPSLSANAAEALMRLHQLIKNPTIAHHTRQQLAEIYLALHP